MTRNHIVLTFLALAAFSIGTHASEPKQPMTPEAYDFMRAYYYLKPSPDLISLAIDYMQKQGIPSKENDKGEVIGFFSEVFIANPKMLPKWREAIATTNGDTQSTLLNAIKYSEQPSLLTQFDPSKDSSKSNDICWGAFYASGKEIYIKALTGRLIYFDEKDNFKLFATAASAQWSLSFNSRHHSRVKAILEEILPKAPPKVKQAINDALETEPERFREIHLRLWIEGQKEKHNI
jgi:hypothetical protein